MHWPAPNNYHACDRPPRGSLQPCAPRGLRLTCWQPCATASCRRNGRNGLQGPGSSTQKQAKSVDMDILPYARAARRPARGETGRHKLRFLLDGIRGEGRREKCRPVLRREACAASQPGDRAGQQGCQQDQPQFFLLRESARRLAPCLEQIYTRPGIPVP